MVYDLSPPRELGPFREVQLEVWDHGTNQTNQSLMLGKKTRVFLKDEQMAHLGLIFMKLSLESVELDRKGRKEREKLLQSLAFMTKVVIDTIAARKH